MLTVTANNVTVLPTPADPDRAALQRLVDHRLARRLGLTLAVAGVVAQLAGLGPQDHRGRR